MFPKFLKVVGVLLATLFIARNLFTTDSVSSSSSSSSSPKNGIQLSLTDQRAKLTYGVSGGPAVQRLYQQTVKPTTTPVKDPRPCTKEQADFQEKYFSAFSDMGRRFGCVADHWEEVIAKAMPNASTFIDIGMNKGYSSANFFSLWAKETQFTPQSVHTVMMRDSGLGKKSCGACHDCSQVYNVPTNIVEHNIRVFGFEPGLNNMKLCETIRVENPSISNNWILSRVAVADKPGRDTFPEGSDETGFIGGAGVDTEITTVDLIIEKNQLDFVDMLKIDTEGFDAPALAGGMKAFRDHRVGVTLFEYHKLNRWWDISLESVVAEMDSVGYTCFLAGKDHVLRLTSCWKPMMEFKWWSNVMCVSRVKASAVVDALDAKSFHTLGKQQFEGKPESSLQKGFNSNYVYGAPPFSELPQNSGGKVTKFTWAK